MDSGVQLVVTDSGILFLVEWVAVISGLFYIIFAARGNRICWVWGLVNALVSVWLFYQTELYAQTILYLYYAFAAIYGWFAWRPSLNDSSGFLKIRNLKYLSHIIIIPVGFGLSYILFWILQKYTTSALPLMDSITTVFSFIATAMVAIKRIENWIYWVFINIISSILYWQNELLWYSILMIVYAILAFAGWWNWRKNYNLQKN